MNLGELTTLQLAELIRAASAEIASRLAEPAIQRIQTERAVIAMRVPSDEDRDFLLRLRTAVEQGSYVTADERNRVAELAVEFGPWIKRQGLPTDRGTGAWRKLKEASRIKPAREK